MAGAAGLWASMRDGSISQKATTWVQDVRQRKWEVPVHVDVDFVKPIYQSSKETILKAWAAVPPEYRPFVPPAGSFLLGVLLTWRIVGGRVRLEREKKVALQKQVQILAKERDDLAAVNSSLERAAGAGRGPSDAVYGKTIAELSAAASESAKVAAELARMCYLPSLAGAAPGGRGQGRSPPRKAADDGVLS